MPEDLMPVYPDQQQDTSGVDWRAVNMAVQTALAAKKAKAQAEEEAVRYQGQQEYNDLIKGGAKPEEALMRTGGKIFFHHPDKQVAAMRSIKPAVNIPQNIQGVPVTTPEGANLGYGVFDPSRGTLHSFARTPKPAAPVIPAEIKVQIDQRKANLASMRRDLERQKKDVEGMTPSIAGAPARRARILQEQIAAEEQKLAALAGGKGAAATPAAAPAGEPLPKSKTDLKAGTTYQTPKGAFTWTGKGWAAAAAPAAAPVVSDGTGVGAPDEEGDASDAE